jgi:hypothetical protein
MGLLDKTRGKKVPSFVKQIFFLSNKPGIGVTKFLICFMGINKV